MINVTILSTGTGVCSLTGKENSDGLTVTFEDGTVKESFLSWRSFRQLVSLKASRQLPVPPRPASIAQDGGKKP